MKDVNRSKNDLKEPFNETVIKSARQPVGQGVFLESEDCIHLYHHDEDLVIGDRLTQRLRAEQGWFEKLIQHAPSVGTFYEDALRALIAELLPQQYRVGTGFIYDVDTRTHSKQLDIVVYDYSKAAPLYNRGEFVIVQPLENTSQSEVKKSLKISDIRNIIRTTFTSYFGNHLMEPIGCHKMLVFSYKSSVKTDKILDVILEEISNIVEKFHVESVSGEKFVAAIFGVVVPSFYFFDRDSYFETHLEHRKNNIFSIKISEYLSNSDNSLNEYIDQMTNSFSNKKSFIKNLRTFPVRNVEREVELKDGILLARRVSMLEILSAFNEDKQNIKSFRFKNKRPYQAVISANVILSETKNFDEFVKLAIAWDCI